MQYIYKYYEADDVPIATVGSGDILIPGTLIRDYIIPDGKIWCICSFHGSSNIDNCEIELLYSDDGGNTWKNPFDDEADKLICLHLDGSCGGHEFTSGFEFTGSESDTILRVEAKNYNTELQSEIISILEALER